MNLTFTLDHIDAVAAEFLHALQSSDHTVVAFYGKMGAGKTTFVKALCTHLGVTDNVTSPTFAIVNEYALPTDSAWGSAVYHFDFYRLRRPEEFFDMGAEEYLESGNLCLMEWPEVVESYLPDDTLVVLLTENPDGTRSLTTNL